jgi:hypothetical protein
MCTPVRFAGVCSIDRWNAPAVRGRILRCRMRSFQRALAVVLAVFMTGRAMAAPPAKAPDERVVVKVVDSYFASVPGYQKGDLIARSQIEKVIAKLEAAKVKVPGAGDIVKLGLADDSFLVRELSTPEGRRFMRKMDQHSGSYAHLDRLSTIPRGQLIVHDLVRQKDGDKFIQYLTNTKGGHNMGNMMAQARGGVDLNKPTGRIYTADDLLAALKSALAKPAP